MVDPYLPFITETLRAYPTLTASRIYVMVKERGYPGGSDHFRAIIRRHRPQRPAEAFLRLKTLPGEQGQVDWAHFGTLTIGRAVRALWSFVMVLSYARQIFVRFFPGASMMYFLRGHVEAFEACHGPCCMTISRAWSWSAWVNPFASTRRCWGWQGTTAMSPCRLPWHAATRRDA